MKTGRKASRKETEPHPLEYKGDLRTVDGRRGLNQHGSHFASCQGEWFSMSQYNNRFASIDWQIGVLELNNGKWLAHPPGWFVYSRQFDSREQALRSAVAARLRLARGLFRYKGMLFGRKIGKTEYSIVVEWLYYVLKAPPRKPYIPPAPPPLVVDPEPVQLLMF